MTDFERQKQEAIERVKRMNSNYRRISGIEDQKKEPVPEKKEEEKIIKNNREKEGDSDLFLLVALLLLLSGESQRSPLLFALLYIML